MRWSRLGFTTFALTVGLVLAAILIPRAPKAQLRDSRLAAPTVQSGDSRLAAVASSGPGWRWQNPSPQGNDLQDIACPSATVCVAVGGNSIVTTTDGGETWRTKTRYTSSAVSGIACISTSTCYASADHGSILTTFTGSKNWHAVSTGVADDLSGIACPDLAHCYAVGGSAIVATADGGRTWRRQGSGGVGNLRNVACPSAGACYAVGGSDSAAGSGTIVATTDEGATWRQQFFNGGFDLTGIACPAENACYAVGTHYPGPDDGENASSASVILATANAGKTWRRQASDGSSGLLDITCTSRSVCYAVGDSILATADGGGTWSVQQRVTGLVPRSSQLLVWLDAITCPMTGVCHVVGDAGAMVATTNGGRTWRAESHTVTPHTVPVIVCPSVSACYALADDTNGREELVPHTRNTFLITSDGGATWRSVSKPATDPYGQNGMGLACPSTRVCYALVYDGVLTSTDAGRTWKRLHIPRLSRIGASLNGIACPSMRRCYVAGSGSRPDPSAVLTTTDAGRTWRVHAMPRLAANLATDYPLYGIACPGETVCYVLAYDNWFLVTRDGGTTWHTGRSGDANAPASGSSIACPSTSVCYVVGSSHGIDVTTDGGKTWRRLGTDTYVGNIHCPSTSVCYATGDSQSSGPLRGLMLHTADGGHTWQRERTPLSRPRDVACPRVDVCYAVGDFGAIVAKH